MIELGGQHQTDRYTFLQIGFRPFFIGATGFALVSILLWMGMLRFGCSGLPAHRDIKARCYTG